MNRSLFPEFVDKYFSRIVGKITDKYNGENREEVLLHKQMLIEEYSPDLKWGSTNINHSIVAADVVALDSPLPLKKRDTVSNASGDIPKMGVKYRKSEKLLTDIQVAQARGAKEADIVSKIFEDTAKCIKSMDVLKEILFRRGLSTGQMLVESEENDGTGIRVSFGYKEANTFHCLADAWLGENPTPQDDIQQMFDKADADGNTISHVYLTKKYIDAFRKSEQGKLLSANANKLVITDKTVLPVLGRNAFLEVLNDEYGAEFHVVSGTFKVQNPDGSEKNAEAWREANVVGTPSNIVGRLVYGTLAEETNPVKNVDYEKSGSHVLIAKYSKTDPLEEFTTAQAIAIPVIDNADGIYVLHADTTAKKKAELGVDTESLSFGKEAGTQSFNIHYDGKEPVTVKSNSDWAKVTRSGAKVTVKVTENIESSRNAEITVTAGSESKTVNVTQEGES